MNNATCSACGAPRIHGRGMCNPCYKRWRRSGNQAPTLTPTERFWAKVNKAGSVSSRRPDLGACWVWTAGLDRYGYGKFKFEGKDRTAHKWAFEEAFGSVPTGLTLDHLCRVRRCVRPSHMEPVPNGENVRRGEVGKWKRLQTHCLRGHAFDQANTLRRGPKQYRICRACAQLRRQRAA